MPVIAMPCVLRHPYALTPAERARCIKAGFITALPDPAHQATAIDFSKGRKARKEREARRKQEREDREEIRQLTQTTGQTTP